MHDGRVVAWVECIECKSWWVTANHWEIHDTTDTEKIYMSQCYDNHICTCFTLSTWKEKRTKNMTNTRQTDNNYLLDIDHRWISDKSIPLHLPPLYLFRSQVHPISITSPTPLHSSLFPLSHPLSLCSLFHWYPFPCHHDPLISHI